MPKPRLHLICNAHLDPVWQWEWEEGAAEALSTFRTAADLCEEFSGFIFCHNEALLYMWIEEYEPALFARIQKLVKEGKWNIMGGWHLQPDCNMPSGESFVRQGLFGLTYFKEKFGVRPTTAINFDPFGHTQGLVQILAKSGYDAYVICRPGQDDCPLPADRFEWVGYDGSTIRVHRMWHYNSPLGNAKGKVAQWLNTFPEEQCGGMLWGVGNHGGGPSRQDLCDLAELIENTTDHTVKHSTLDKYWKDFSSLNEELPQHNADLNPWAVGCYTSQIRIKQKHRLLENEYYAMEKMATAASVAGLMEYPKAELASALYDLLTSEFHDTIPGSSIQPVEETSIRALDHGLETVSRAKARSFFALAAGQPKAKEGEIPILVFNPHPYPVQAIVECEFMLADQNWEDNFTMARVFQGRKRLPGQHEKEDSNLNLDWRKRVAFLADLQPMQMNRFDCKLEVLPEKPALPQVQYLTGIFNFHTDDLDVEINLTTGLLNSYKVAGVEYLKAPAGEGFVMADNEDPWGMLVHGFGDLAGKFELMTPEDSAKFAGTHAEALPPVRIIEDGEVRTVLEASFRYNHSALLLRYKLPKQGTEVEIEARVQWAEKDKLLKLSIPVAGDSLKYLGQVAYGVGELPCNGDEAVAQKWVAVVADEANALTCINDSIYGSDCSEAGLRLTLLRSPAFTGHPIGDRSIVPQDRFIPRIDQGERLYHFWLNAGPVAERLEKVDREALVHNEKPMTLSFFPSGQGTTPAQLVRLKDSIIQMNTLKKSEDGKAIILRLFNPTAKAQKTTLEMPAIGIKQALKFGAYEIKTLRIDAKKKTVIETDLLEKPVKK